MCESEKRMRRDDSERTISDLCVIFERPIEESSDMELGVECDAISVLGHSMSDFSCGSRVDPPRPHSRRPHFTSTLSCKRIDRRAFFRHRSSSNDSSLDDRTNTSLETASTIGSCTTDSSPICYFAGDRWSTSAQLSPRKKLSHTETADNSPQAPSRSPWVSALDCSPRKPVRTWRADDMPTISL